MLLNCHGFSELSEFHLSWQNISCNSVSLDWCTDKEWQTPLNHCALYITLLVSDQYYESKFLRYNFSVTSPLLHVVLKPIDFKRSIQKSLHFSLQESFMIPFMWSFMLQPKKAILTHGTDFYKLEMLIISDEFRGEKT